MSRVAKPSIGDVLDALLRGHDRNRQPLGLPRTHVLLGTIVVCGCTYGTVMGSFSLRPLQMLYSALKVPLLFAVTFVISLPAFYVLNTLAGLRDDFNQSIRALAATQAGVNVVLLSLSPLTLVWYVSCLDYSMAVVFNTVMFAISSVAGQMLLTRFYRPLIQRNSRHGTMLKVWLVIFSFVGVQTGWMLRPFIGSPQRATTFVRMDDWSNAYVAVFRLFVRVATEDPT
ncbi:MAG: hypothetical protein AB8G99_11590 [Planctomycetaceae bacterium]